MRELATSARFTQPQIGSVAQFHNAFEFSGVETGHGDEGTTDDAEGQTEVTEQREGKREGYAIIRITHYGRNAELELPRLRHVCSRHVIPTYRFGFSIFAC